MRRRPVRSRASAGKKAGKARIAVCIRPAGVVMNEETAFIRGLIADPGDRALRLVYADWLEERGDPASCRRAASLRRECRHGGFPPNPVNDEEGRVFCPAFARVID